MKQVVIRATVMRASNPKFRFFFRKVWIGYKYAALRNASIGIRTSSM
jgi:hypothetical protein